MCRLRRAVLLASLLAVGLVGRPSRSVLADPLSEIASGSPTFAVTLNGANQIRTSGALNLHVVDNRGGGDGWNVTITSTIFSAGLRTLPVSALNVTGVTSTCTAPACTNPTNAIAYPVTVPAGLIAPPAVRLFDAAKHTGLGSFTINPTFSVAVPANAYVGNYTSVVIFSIVNGP